MKFGINTNDGEGYLVILNEFSTIEEVIKYANTHDYLLGQLSNSNRPIAIVTNKITTIIN